MKTKNSSPSSEFEDEDKYPSCGSPCDIHTDLDENDECNECGNDWNIPIIPTKSTKQELPKTEIDWSKFPKSTQKQVAEKYFRGLGEKDDEKSFTPDDNLQKKISYSEEEIMNALHSVELKYNRDFTKIYEGVLEYLKELKKK